MLYKFHITGVAQVGYDRYDSSCPIDITVYSDTEQNALDKAKSVLGYPVAGHNRKIVIEEILGQDSLLNLDEIKQHAYKEFVEKFEHKLSDYPCMSDDAYNYRAHVRRILKELEE